QRQQAAAREGPRRVRLAHAPRDGRPLHRARGQADRPAPRRRRRGRARRAARRPARGRALPAGGRGDARPPDRAEGHAEHGRRRRAVDGARGGALSATQQLDNPLLQGLRLRRTPEPCVLVIFGASGDLTRRKLFPALYSLAFRGLLPEKFGLVGVARTAESDDDFRERMKEAVQQFARDPFRDDVWGPLADAMRYVGMEFAEDAAWE